MHALPALLATALYTLTFVAAGPRSGVESDSVTVSLSPERYVAVVSGAAEGAAERADLEFNAMILRARDALVNGELRAAERLLHEAGKLEANSPVLLDLRRLLDLCKAALHAA
jgi:hypothetical protein